jgi:hypothetical protein
MDLELLVVARRAKQARQQKVQQRHQLVHSVLSSHPNQQEEEERVSVCGEEHEPSLLLSFCTSTGVPVSNSLFLELRLNRDL